MINMDMFTLSRPQPVRYTTFTICQVSDCLGDCKIVFLALLQVSDSLCTGKIVCECSHLANRRGFIHFSLISHLPLNIFILFSVPLLFMFTHTHMYACTHTYRVPRQWYGCCYEMCSAYLQNMMAYCGESLYQSRITKKLLYLSNIFPNSVISSSLHVHKHQVGIILQTSSKTINIDNVLVS